MTRRPSPEGYTLSPIPDVVIGDHRIAALETREVRFWDQALLRAIFCAKSTQANRRCKRMRDIDDDLLECMTSRELLELQARIHDAIRTHIRLKNAQKSSAAGPRPTGMPHLPHVEESRQRSLAVHARTRHATDPAAVLNAPSRTGKRPLVGDGAFDLERERDSWVARRRSTGG